MSELTVDHTCLSNVQQRQISQFCHLTEWNQINTHTHTIKLSNYQITNQSINQLFKQVNELL